MFIINLINIYARIYKLMRRIVAIAKYVRFLAEHFVTHGQDSSVVPFRFRNLNTRGSSVVWRRNRTVIKCTGWTRIVMRQLNDEVWIKPFISYARFASMRIYVPHSDFYSRFLCMADFFVFSRWPITPRRLIFRTPVLLRKFIGKRDNK